jgi:hypothetical protein
MPDQVTAFGLGCKFDLKLPQNFFVGYAQDFRCEGFQFDKTDIHSGKHIHCITCVKHGQFPNVARSFVSRKLRSKGSVLAYRHLRRNLIKFHHAKKGEDGICWRGLSCDGSRGPVGGDL